MKYLLLFVFTATAYAVTLDDQIATLQAKSDSLQQEAWTLESQKQALALDAVALEDSTLKADHVHVVRAWASPEWVKIAVDKLSAADYKVVKYALKDADLSFEAIGTDTLYMRKDRAEKALPVISAALKE